MKNIKEHEIHVAIFEKYKELLTQTQRQALYLSLIEDLSLSEIAEITATSRSAIYDAIRKGKKKLIEISNKLENTKY